MALRIDYGSDIHEEFYYSRLDWGAIKNPDSDILILAGDNENTAYGVVSVIDAAQKHYKHVLYVPGNHDFYETQQSRLVTPENPYTVSERMNFWSRRAKSDGWTFLPDSDFIVEDTVIIGENGWYGFNYPNYSNDLQKSTWKRYMSDSRYIHFDKNRPPELLAMEDSQKLSEKIKKYDKDESVKNIVVVTHTLPIIDALIIKPNDLVWNLLSGGFYNSKLEDVALLSKKVKYWVFGHTHSIHNIVKNHTRFLCNPRGYSNEAVSLNWKPKMIII